MDKSSTRSPLHSNQRHIVVVGGGVTGLATIYYLRQALGSQSETMRITLMERGGRLGGKLLTEQAGGFLLDGGPDCFLTRKPWALELCRELGLDDSLLDTNEAQREVYVLNKGRLHALPEGVMLIVPTRFLPFALSPLISIPGKLRMGLDLFIPRRSGDNDETLGSFVRRRLGQEALDKIAEPLLSGIHVSDPDQLSLKSTFPRLMEVERKYGSLIRGMLAARRQMNAVRKSGRPALPMFMSLEGGMQQITDGLVAHIAHLDIDVLTHTAVISITSQNSGGAPYVLHLQSGETVQADALVLSTPSDVTSRLVRPLDAQLADMLGTIRYVSTAVVALGYKNGPEVPRLSGFGFIIPESEQRRITACTYSSTKFAARAPEGHQLLRCFMGGPGRETILELDDQALLKVARQELADILGLQGTPSIARVFRWPKMNPQYDLNHLDRVAEMRARAASHGPLQLAGCAYDGVGVPDCIRQGKEAAEAIVAQMREC